MKVFLVFCGSYEQRKVLAVFKDEKLRDKFLQKQRIFGRTLEEFSYTSYEVDDEHALKSCYFEV
ncbi:MAG: hypothetical protein HKM06_07665, partial [Spirochaetales bacterium]|nr:hypothetical protein [Spirochaetales bacterium]